MVSKSNKFGHYPACFSGYDQFWVMIKKKVGLTHNTSSYFFSWGIKYFYDRHKKSQKIIKPKLFHGINEVFYF